MTKQSKAILACVIGDCILFGLFLCGGLLVNTLMTGSLQIRDTVFYWILSASVFSGVALGLKPSIKILIEARNEKALKKWN